MKKTVFYSMIRKDGQNVAKRQNGYTDGTYNYYKGEFGTWYAIQPETGLSIYSSSTRKTAAEGAHAPEMAEKVARALDRMGENAKQNFKKALEATKGAA